MGTCYPSTLEVEARGPGEGGHPWLELDLRTPGLPETLSQEKTPTTKEQTNKTSQPKDVGKEAGGQGSEVSKGQSVHSHGRHSVAQGDILVCHKAGLGGSPDSLSLEHMYPEHLSSHYLDMSFFINTLCLFFWTHDHCHLILE